jgi:hypothetical protein
MGRSNGIPKSVLLATRVTPRISEKIKQLAFREGLYVSEWIRQLIVSELKNQNLLGTPLQAPQNRYTDLLDEDARAFSVTR